jgi:hypothetical protein
MRVRAANGMARPPTVHFIARISELSGPPDSFSLREIHLQSVSSASFRIFFSSSPDYAPPPKRFGAQEAEY